MKPSLKTALRSLFVLLAVVGVAAFGALLAMQFLPESAHAHVRMGGHHIEVQGIFMRGFFDLFVAWAAIVIGTLATLFALAVTAVVLGLVAIVLGMPMILLCLIVWFVIRQTRRSQARSALA